MDLKSFYRSELDEHAAVLGATIAQCEAPFLRLCEAAATSLKGGGKLLFFGNGGSAGDAQHLATELAVRYVRDRAPIPAIALTTDTSALTAIGITTSGRSRNVIRGLEVARELGLGAAALSGNDGGMLPGIADPLLIVPSRVTARIQEMHITLGQMLCGALERMLGLV